MINQKAHHNISSQRPPMVVVVRDIAVVVLAPIATHHAAHIHAAMKYVMPPKLVKVLQLVKWRHKCLRNTLNCCLSLIFNLSLTSFDGVGFVGVWRESARK